MARTRSHRSRGPSAVFVRLSLTLAACFLAAALVLAWRGMLPGAEILGGSGSQARLAPEARAASTTGSWYELAFTNPIYPDDRRNHKGGLDERLAELMDTAQTSLDVAVYEFDLQPIADAMARAARRGVRVRMVTDSDTLGEKDRSATQRALGTVKDAKIPIVPDNRKPIMHDKFTVVDGQWVQTGSWNYTDSETYRNNNNAIIIHSPELAANYTAVFEKMFTTGTFGPAKAAGVPYPSFSIAGARVENYFSPEDRPANQVIRWVRSAQQQIHFLAFSFTHDGIGDAMMERSQAGVSIAGVFETQDSTTRFSEYPRFKQAGLDVIQDGNPWRMHHKVILIDDHISIFGSFNFSNNANRENDENLLIVDDPGLAASLEAEFQRVRERAVHPPPRS